MATFSSFHSLHGIPKFFVIFLVQFFTVLLVVLPFLHVLVRLVFGFVFVLLVLLLSLLLFQLVSHAITGLFHRGTSSRLQLRITAYLTRLDSSVRTVTVDGRFHR